MQHNNSWGGGVDLLQPRGLSLSRRQLRNLSELSVASWGARQRFSVETTIETWHLFALSVIARADKQ